MKALMTTAVCGLLAGPLSAAAPQGEELAGKICSVRWKDNRILLLDQTEKPVLAIGKMSLRNRKPVDFLLPESVRKVNDGTLEITFRAPASAKVRRFCTGTVRLLNNGIRFSCTLLPLKGGAIPENVMLEVIPLKGTVRNGTPEKVAYQELYSDGGSVSFSPVVAVRSFRSPGGQKFMIPLNGQIRWGSPSQEHILFERNTEGGFTAALDIVSPEGRKKESDPLLYADAYSLHVDRNMKGDDGFFPLGVLGESLDSGFMPLIGGNYMVMGYNPFNEPVFSEKGVTGLSIWAAIHSQGNRNVKHAFDDQGKEQRQVCLFDKASREIIFDYARNAVKKVLETEGGRLFKWEIDNEYIPPLDYSPAAVEQFRVWLEKSYRGDSAKWNRAWRTEGKSFRDAVPPKLSEFDSKPAAFLDWSRFQQETFAEFLGEYYSVIYNADPLHRSVNGKDTQSSLEMQRIARTKRSNHELIGKAIAPYTKGVRGMDHYGHGDRNAYEINYYYNTIVPAGHKPGTRAGMLYGENNNHNGPGWQFAQTVWRVIPNGFRGGHFFCNGWFGCWGDWASFGFTNPDGTRRDKFYYLPRFYSMIHRSERFLTQSAIPQKTDKVAILFAQRDVPFGVDDNITPWGFPINSRLRLYSRLRDAGYWVQIITYDKLKKEYMKDVKALFLVGAEHLSNAEISDIRNYVKDGGVLFADTRAGFFDEHHLPHSTGLSDVLGVRFKGLFVSHDVVVDPGDVWFESPNGNLVRADGRVNYELTTAAIVNKYHAFSVSNKAAILTKNRYGKGSAYWINTQFGTIRSESAVGERPAADWYKKLLTDASVQPSYTMSPDRGEYFRAEIPLVDENGNCFLTVAGTTYEPVGPQELSLNLPPECDFQYAFYALAEDNQLHKLPFRREKGGRVVFRLPEIKSAAALYLFRKHAPLLGTRIDNAKCFVKADPNTAEFRPGERFKVTVQIANPNDTRLREGTLALRAFQDWTVSPPQKTKPLDGGEIAEYQFDVTIPEKSGMFRPNFIYPLTAEFFPDGRRTAVTHMVVSIAVDLNGRELLLSDNWNSANWSWAVWTDADYRTLTEPDPAKGERIADSLHTTLGHGKKVYSLQSGDRADRLRSAVYKVPEAEVEFDLKNKYELTRLVIRRGNRALETPEFIEAALSADGRTFSAPVKVIPQWKADCTQIPLKGAARYIRIKFIQAPGKASRIDEVWILGKLIRGKESGTRW